MSEAKEKVTGITTHILYAGFMFCDVLSTRMKIESLKASVAPNHNIQL